MALFIKKFGRNFHTGDARKGVCVGGCVCVGVLGV